MLHACVHRQLLRFSAIHFVTKELDFLRRTELVNSREGVIRISFRNKNLVRNDVLSILYMLKNYMRRINTHTHTCKETNIDITLSLLKGLKLTRPYDYRVKGVVIVRGKAYNDGIK